jgi:hypothetical protein
VIQTFTDIFQPDVTLNAADAYSQAMMQSDRIPDPKTTTGGQESWATLVCNHEAGEFENPRRKTTKGVTVRFGESSLCDFAPSAATGDPG